MEIEVNGKKVVLRDKVCASRGAYDLMLKIREVKTIEDASFEDQVALMRLLIESWELDGDPAKTETYEKIDLFAEFFPLIGICLEHLNKIASPSKN